MVENSSPCSRSNCDSQIHLFYYCVFSLLLEDKSRKTKKNIESVTTTVQKCTKRSQLTVKGQADDVRNSILLIYNILSKVYVYF